MAERTEYLNRYELRLERVGRICESPDPILCPTDTLPVIRALCADKAQENYVALALDSRNKVIATSVLFVGSLNACIVHPREVFAFAIQARAASLILAHNHPSGDTTPSREDLDLSRRLVQAGRIMGIEILDCLVISQDTYVSLKEAGTL